MKRKLVMGAALLLLVLIIIIALFCLLPGGHKLPEPAETALAALPEGEGTAVYVGQSAYLADFPAPYSAMLAICSDIDGSNLESFQRYHYFLNTGFWQPELGIYGLSLDVADSFWVYGGVTENAFSVFEGMDTESPAGLNDIAWYWKLGYIDSLHSFGDFSGDVSPRRDYAERAWEVLAPAGVSPKVFINHGSESNKLNFGGHKQLGLMRYQEGDDPGSEYYHTDITLPAGIRYVWASEGSSRYGMDSPLYLIDLRDGQKVWGFERFTHQKKGLKNDWLWTPSRLSEEFTQEQLDGLAADRQFAIVANHLGSDDIMSYQANVYALLRLKQYQDEGKILVARTSRLLDYALARDYVRYAVTEDESSVTIDILELADPTTGSRVPGLEELRGLTFLIPADKDARLLLSGEPIGGTGTGSGADDGSVSGTDTGAKAGGETIPVSTGLTEDGQAYVMIDWYR